MSEKRNKDWGVRVLWALVAVALVVFLVTYIRTARVDVKIDAVEQLNEEMREAVHGEYKDREIVIKDPRLWLLRMEEKSGVYAAVISIVESSYYELADTLYDTTLEITGGEIRLRLDALYKDYSVHESLGVEEWVKLSDKEFIDNAGRFIRENFKYRVGKKITVEEFIEQKVGQCYSYSDLMYLLGKERGMDIRVKISSMHSWNSYIDENGREVEFDMTVGLEELK